MTMGSGARVVVVGGGFGGLYAAQASRGKDTAARRRSETGFAREPLPLAPKRGSAKQQRERYRQYVEVGLAHLLKNRPPSIKDGALD
jgi:NADH dehydrogenase FAD-containing subunit